MAALPGNVELTELTPAQTECVRSRAKPVITAALVTAGLRIGSAVVGYKVAGILGAIGGYVASGWITMPLILKPAANRMIRECNLPIPIA